MVKKESSKIDQTKSKVNNDETQKSNFVGNTQDELTKVVWPSRQQLLSESAAVILMVSLVATVIYLVDNLFSWGAGKVF
ncbi:MAG: preprotein translocase subunit SecE [cyanobacterium endosymbiont of Rhopalodia musculus]|uniref:preprotein translocase subunit SecE n=1 Tax=cyanobacterium endosymbiont of Epithemia clementina EcSB TaxID=3034674 RepID=UPI00386E209F